MVSDGLHALRPVLRLHGRQSCPVEEEIILNGTRARFPCRLGKPRGFPYPQRVSSLTSHRSPSVWPPRQPPSPSVSAPPSTPSFSLTSSFVVSPASPGSMLLLHLSQKTRLGKADISKAHQFRQHYLWSVSWHTGAVRAGI